MKCTKCGAELSANQKFCTFCGTKVPQIYNNKAVLNLTAAEATFGCQKELYLPGFAAPMRFNLRPGITDKCILEVKNARYIDENGFIVIRPLQVTVRVMPPKPTINVKVKKKKPIWLFAVLFMVLICTAVALNVIENIDDGADWGDFAYVKRDEDDNRSVENTLPEEDAPEIVEAGKTVYDAAEDMIPYFELRYFLNELDEDELLAFCEMYQSYMNFDEYCVLSKGISKDLLLQLIALLKVECPEVMQADSSREVEYQYLNDKDNILKIKLPYDMEEDEYIDMLDECEDAILDLIKATAGMSELEKEKYVFDYIALNCSYDMDAENSENAYGALIEGRAKCDGIGLAMKWAMEAMGIQCLCITADTPGKEIGHAWNIISIDGEYYTLDVTPSVRYDSLTEEGFSGIYYFAYNISDDWYEEKHDIHDIYYDIADVPDCKTMEESYYYQAGMFVSENEDPTDIFEDTMSALARNGGGDAALQFEDSDDLYEFIGKFSDYVTEWDKRTGIDFEQARYFTFSYNTCLIKLEL